MSDYQISSDLESRRKQGTDSLAIVLCLLCPGYLHVYHPRWNPILHLLHASHFGLKCLSSLFFPIQVQFYCLDLYFCLLTPWYSQVTYLAPLQPSSGFSFSGLFACLCQAKLWNCFDLVFTFMPTTWIQINSFIRFKKMLFDCGRS